MADDLNRSADEGPGQANIADARRAYDLRSRDPVAALELTAAVLARAGRGDLDVIALAHRTAALCLLDTGEIAAARTRARRAVTVARRGAAPGVLAGCLTTGAALEFILGGSSAFTLLDEATAAAHLAGDANVLVDARCQRAWMLQRGGRWREALATLDDLLAGTSSDPPLLLDDLLRFPVLGDRACVLAELSRFSDALACFDAALELGARVMGPDAADVIETARNRAVCLTRAGRIPAAMAAFGDLDDRLAETPAQRLRLLVGQADLLLDAGLRAEALEVTEAALAIAGPGTPPMLRAEAAHQRAVALAAAGEPAGELARAAVRRFRRCGMTGRAALAGLLVARSSSGRRRLAAMERCTTALQAAGLNGYAAEARLDALTTAIALGDGERAAAHREQLAAWRDRGPALTRIRAWLGEARFAAWVGDAEASRAAVHAGLLVLDQHRSVLGATELRVHATGLGEELTDLASGLAIDAGDAWRLLRTSERWRAGAVLRRPQVADDLAEALADLRGVLAQADDPEAPPEVLAAFDADRAAIERRVRTLARRSESASASVVRPPRLAELRDALGDSALVEIIVHRGRNLAVVVDGRPRMVDLGPVEPPEQTRRELVFALRRMARSGIGAAAAAAARDSAQRSLERLSELLVEPLGLSGRGALVVVPTAALHAVPWPALPALAQTVVTLAPSATWWARPSLDPVLQSSPPLEPAATRIVLAAGPRLTGAIEELDRVSARHPSADVLHPAHASGDTLRRLLDGADLAHLACHGHLRADHPQLSSLEFADGPVTVYDLERLHRAPRQVVLSACESGVSAARPGEELLGYLTALLSLGTREVVASVVPVPDLATVELMDRFHGEVSAGTAFPAALHRARASLLDTDSGAAAFVVATAFVAVAQCDERTVAEPPATG